MSAASEPALVLRNVTKVFSSVAGRVRAVDDVSLELSQGECLGLIGESGSGKSTLARLAIGLQAPDSGSVAVAGTELSSLKPKQLQSRRGEMSMVFQDPLGSLNPRHRVRTIVEEPLKIHFREFSAAQRAERVDEALRRVALEPSIGNRRPAELSGGQQQRVSIARAIVTRPTLMVLDEPTSALDLSVQAQILTLLSSLREEMGLAFLFISHDVKAVGYLSDRVAVMYHGSLLEQGPVDEVLTRPDHPYTKALLGTALSVDPRVGQPLSPPAGGVGNRLRQAPLARARAHGEVKGEIRGG